MWSSSICCISEWIFSMSIIFKKKKEEGTRLLVKKMMNSIILSSMLQFEMENSKEKMYCCHAFQWFRHMCLSSTNICNFLCDSLLQWPSTKTIATSVDNCMWLAHALEHLPIYSCIHQKEKQKILHIQKPFNKHS
jgi:hypothetical protein